MKEFDIDNWSRKKQFEFFRNYKDPFFNISANLDITNLYKYCKKQGYSFSLACLHGAIHCANSIPEFKLRLIQNKVYSYSNVHIGSTILNSDETFSFCYFEYFSELRSFIKNSERALEDHKVDKSFKAEDNRFDLIHCSTIPWVSFTGFKHARKGNEGAVGIPKIVFGKWFESGVTKQIPFSVEVHHALMDGIHVGKYFKKMQSYFDGLV